LHFFLSDNKMAEKPEDLNLPTSIVTKIIKVYIILDILYSLGLLGIYGRNILHA
jgi:hypothetical protein